MKEKTKEPQVDAEYERLSKSESLYQTRIGSWHKINRFTLYAFPILFLLVLASMLSIPEGKPLPELFPTHPIQVVSFLIGSGLFLVAILLYFFSEEKVSKISNELGLHREERLFLRAYDVHKNIDSYLFDQSRKSYLRKMALKNAEEMTEIVSRWNYGNIGLVKKLVGDQIDLLRDNLKRLVLPNVAEGDDVALKRISNILVEFCKHLSSPSTEKLVALNETMKDLPFKEYKILTREEMMSNYFYSRPRQSRIGFAICITAIPIAILLYLGQNLGLIVAVGVTCFWGAFTGFDKLFKVKE